MTITAVFLALSMVMAFIPADANAARSSKPKEIVVVGSKVKEVIRSAGFATEGNVVARLAWHVRALLHRAMDRAERNGRYTLHAYDLDDLAMRPGGVRMIKPAIISEVARRAGYRPDAEFLHALDTIANPRVEEAIARAGANGRSTVRPYDL
jgi:hypothetical protein